MRFQPIRHIDSDFNDLISRRGKFTITMEQMSEEWELYMALMGKMIIWRAEATWVDNALHYEAVSRLFAVTSEGAQAPVYEFEFDEGTITDRGGPPLRRVSVTAVGGSGETVHLIVFPKRKESHEDGDLQSEDRGEEVQAVEGTVDGTVEGREKRST